MTTRAKGVALALATAAISGAAIFVNSYGVERFDDATVYTTAKNGIAGVLLLLLALPALNAAADRRGRVKSPRSTAHAAALFAVAIVGGSVPFVLFFEGLARASSTQAAFIHKTLVIWVALLAVPLLGERLSRAHFAAIALLIAGQAALVRDVGTVAVGAGELMIFGATLLWSVEVLVVKRLLDLIAAPTLAAARLALGTLFLLGYVIVSGRWGELTSLDGSQWAWALLTGVLLAGYVATWYAALARAQAIDVTAVLVLAAVVTAILDRTVEGVPLDLVGLALITLGSAAAAALALRSVRRPSTA
jgi:drug/metabolite transporter (DMT)-like permease